MKEGQQAAQNLWEVALSAKYQYAVCTIREFGDPWTLDLSCAAKWQGFNFFEQIAGFEMYTLVALVDNVSGHVMRLHQEAAQ